MTETLYPAREASAYLREHGFRSSPGTLAKTRVDGTGPKFRRLGRTVRYPQTALDEFIAARMSPLLSSTSDPGRPERDQARAAA
jgi:hypothetical protein